MRYLYSSFYTPLTKIIFNKQLFCCHELQEACSDKKTNIFYELRIRDFYLQLYFDISGIQLKFCPFCGNKFSEDLSDSYRQALAEELGINVDDAPGVFETDNIPDDFLSDAWWKKRNL